VKGFRMNEQYKTYLGGYIVATEKSFELLLETGYEYDEDEWYNGTKWNIFFIQPSGMFTSVKNLGLHNLKEIIIEENQLSWKN
jgi:hypothetical protein